jgi:hypothetical protein
LRVAGCGLRVEECAGRKRFAKNRSVENSRSRSQKCCGTLSSSTCRASVILSVTIAKRCHNVFSRPQTLCTLRAEPKLPRNCVICAERVLRPSDVSTHLLHKCWFPFAAPPPRRRRSQTERVRAQAGGIPDSQELIRTVAGQNGNFATVLLSSFDKSLP